MLGDVAVSSYIYRYRRGVGLWLWLVGRRAAGCGAVKVSADHGLALNDCFTTEDDSLRPVDLGAAGDFVARVLFSVVRIGVLGGQ